MSVSNLLDSGLSTSVRVQSLDTQWKGAGVVLNGATPVVVPAPYLPAGAILAVTVTALGGTPAPVAYTIAPGGTAGTTISFVSVALNTSTVSWVCVATP